MSGPIRNSTWRVSSKAVILPAGDYRILEVWPELNLLIVFRLDRTTQTARPLKVPLNLFTESVRRDEILATDYPIPVPKLLSERELPAIWGKRRNDRYELIRPLVEDETFLLRFVEKSRSPEVVARARSLGKEPILLYRALAEYWQYGQVHNALVPLFSNSGGRGKPKTNRSGDRGRPKSQPQFGFSPRTPYALTDQDKKQIRRAVKKYYLQGKSKTLTKTYHKYLAKYHFAELQLAADQNRAAMVPSLSQFRYWHKKLYDPIEDRKKRDGAISWEMHHRALLSSISQHVHAPGDRYEIDATTADVYVVSKFNRRRVLGRPVIYVIIDEASRIVAGLFVDLIWASWDAAKQALLNAFLPKKEFCARYGLTIEDADWPCRHLPRSLLCDRAEMFHSAPEQLLAPMGIKLEFAAPLRADWKSVVERRFGIANDEALHDLPGTTRGKTRRRTDPDPKTKALHTLDEVIHLLVADFIEFNKTRHIDDLVTAGLVAEDLNPTPLNYWNYHVSRQLHSLSVLDETQVRAELMRPALASITRRGIKLGDVYYSCRIAEQEHWFELARVNGEYQVEARLDDDNSSRIYVRKDSSSPLAACDLLPRETLYANLHRADIMWLNEWKREKRETGQDLLGRVRQAGEVERLKEEALAHRHDTVGTFPTAPNQITDLVGARNEEKRQIGDTKVSDSNANIQPDQPIRELTLRSKLALIEQVLDDDDQ